MSLPTALEQYLLEMINRDRADPQAAAVRHGLPASAVPSTPLQPLVMNQDLIDAARKHSQWMDQTDTFSHTGANGSTPTTRSKAEGWVGQGVGENISGHFSSASSVDDKAVIEQRHHSLMLSSGHRANLMNNGYAEAGIGIDFGAWQSYRYAALVTEDFSNRNLNYVTGVAFADADKDRFYDPGEGLANIQIKVTGADGAHTTTSWASGGYQLALADGQYQLQFSGGALGADVVTRSVTIHGDNVKIDLNTAIDKPSPADPNTPLTLNGTEAADTLAGHGGHDKIYGNGGNDSLSGALGNDLLDGGIGNDTLMGGAGNDILRGQAGNDTIFGDAGTDQLVGGAGNDIMRGGLGNDISTGGTHRDRFDYNSIAEGGSGEHIRDFDSRAGGDVLDLKDLFDSIHYAGSNPVADGYLHYRTEGTATVVEIDADGRGTASHFVPLVSLDHLVLAQNGTVEIVT